MANASAIDTSRSPEERQKRRRIRRLKRNARMAGPFLGLPLLVGTLALSVDLITYTPTPKSADFADIPIPNGARLDPTSLAIPTDAIRRTSVVGPPSGLDSLELRVERDVASIPRDFGAPTPPYSLGSRR